MKQIELEYFIVDGEYGGDQDWLTDPWMKLGGCGAVTACDLSTYLARYRGMTQLVPFDASVSNIKRKDYVGLTRIMKPYLKPRWSGINTTKIYHDGLQEYFDDFGGEGLRIEEYAGANKTEDAFRRIEKHLEEVGLPIPILILHHKNPAMEDYVWHWFLLTGCKRDQEELQVKTVTYGEENWVDFRVLWDTGHTEKGGLIFVYEDAQKGE